MERNRARPKSQTLHEMCACVCVNIVTSTSRGDAATKAKLQTTKVCLSTEYMVNQ